MADAERSRPLAAARDFVGMTDYIPACEEFGGASSKQRSTKYIHATATPRDDGRFIFPRTPTSMALSSRSLRMTTLPRRQLGLAQEIARASTSPAALS